MSIRDPRVLFVFATLLLFTSLPLSAQSSPALAEKPNLKFVHHPTLKIGITTQNFVEAIEVNLQSVMGLLDESSSQGFTFVEIRDPNADLNAEECKQIAAHAKELGIAIAYTNQRGLLDEDFWEIFEKGVKLAPLFEGTKTIRALCAMTLFDNDLDKKGFTKDEFDRLVEIANRAAALAKANGLLFIIENSSEPLVGNGTVYGLTEILEATSDDVGWQCDTANFFSGARLPVTSEQAISFLRQHASKMRYIHLKSSIDQTTQPMLTDNPLDYGDVFQALADAGVVNVAIELAASDDADEVRKNIVTSVQYLTDHGHLIAR